MLHGYKATAFMLVPRDFMLNKVTKKLIAPAILLSPAMCKLKIAKSTAGPSWNSMLDNGG